MRKALLNRIIPISSIDGPGNRMVLFFQSCQFRCTYCHNPETINPCIHCGLCVEGCPADALSLTDRNKVEWNPALCIDCGQCTDVCPHLSSPKVREVTVDDLMKQILKAAPFLRGISCSGGEATLYSDFLSELFLEIKNKTDLTCLVDTNGGVELDQDFINLCDGFMVDLKSGDPDEHLKITGRELAPVLENIKKLKRAGKLTELRTVIAPHLNNTVNVRQGALLAGADIPYKLLPYRSQGVRKEGLLFHGKNGPGPDEMNHYLKMALDEGALLAEVHTAGIS